MPNHRPTPAIRVAANILVGFVALSHLGFLVLEMFLWQSPAIVKSFGMTPEQAAHSAVLAQNQGLYNGFLAAGLIAAMLWRRKAAAFEAKIFVLVCVIVAGIFGGVTAKLSIAFVQAMPAAIALAVLLAAGRPQVEGNADGHAS